MGTENEFHNIPDKISEEEPGGSDIMSDNEGKQFAEDSLGKKAEEAEFQRREGFKQHFGHITVFALYAMALGVIIFGVTWIWHIILPSKWHWLQTAQLERIQSIFTGGVLAGLISEQFRKRIK